MNREDKIEQNNKVAEVRSGAMFGKATLESARSAISADSFPKKHAEELQSRLQDSLRRASGIITNQHNSDELFRYSGGKENGVLHISEAYLTNLHAQHTQILEQITDIEQIRTSFESLTTEELKKDEIFFPFEDVLGLLYELHLQLAEEIDFVTEVVDNPGAGISRVIDRLKGVLRLKKFGDSDYKRRFDQFKSLLLQRQQILNSSNSTFAKYSIMIEDRIQNVRKGETTLFLIAQFDSKLKKISNINRNAVLQIEEISKHLKLEPSEQDYEIASFLRMIKQHVARVTFDQPNEAVPDEIASPEEFVDFIMDKIANFAWNVTPGTFGFADLDITPGLESHSIGNMADLLSFLTEPGRAHLYPEYIKKTGDILVQVWNYYKWNSASRYGKDNYFANGASWDDFIGALKQKSSPERSDDTVWDMFKGLAAVENNFFDGAPASEIGRTATVLYDRLGVIDLIRQQDDLWYLTNYYKRVKGETKRQFAQSFDSSWSGEDIYYPMDETHLEYNAKVYARFKRPITREQFEKHKNAFIEWVRKKMDSQRQMFDQNARRNGKTFNWDNWIKSEKVKLLRNQEGLKFLTKQEAEFILNNFTNFMPWQRATNADILQTRTMIALMSAADIIRADDNEHKRKGSSGKYTRFFNEIAPYLTIDSSSGSPVLLYRGVSLDELAKSNDSTFKRILFELELKHKKAGFHSGSPQKTLQKMLRYGARMEDGAYSNAFGLFQLPEWDNDYVWSFGPEFFSNAFRHIKRYMKNGYVTKMTKFIPMAFLTRSWVKQAEIRHPLYGPMPVSFSDFLSDERVSFKQDFNAHMHIWKGEAHRLSDNFGRALDTYKLFHDGLFEFIGVKSLDEFAPLNTEAGNKARIIEGFQKAYKTAKYQVEMYNPYHYHKLVLDPKIGALVQGYIFGNATSKNYPVQQSYMYYMKQAKSCSDRGDNQNAESYVNKAEKRRKQAMLEVVKDIIYNLVLEELVEYYRTTRYNTGDPKTVFTTLIQLEDTTTDSLVKDLQALKSILAEPGTIFTQAEYDYFNDIFIPKQSLFTLSKEERTEGKGRRNVLKVIPKRDGSDDWFQELNLRAMTLAANQMDYVHTDPKYYASAFDLHVDTASVPTDHLYTI